MYDTIVVGAGPAGAAAAFTLAGNGYRVLLVEKFRIPRNKSCSGVPIGKSLDWVKRCFGEDVPAGAMCTPVENRGMVFTDHRGKTYRFEQKGLNVWRSAFDGWLAERAAAAGAEIRDGTAAIACREEVDHVLVTLHGKDTYTEKARYVIDCEGVVGALKGKLIGSTRDFITTYQTFNTGSIDLDLHYFYAYLQPELSEYDAWFNVKDDQLVLGVSVRDSKHIAGYYERFLSYMRVRHHLQIDSPTRAEKWLMPCIHPGCPLEYGRGRVLFAGETAGFLNPMGEGISAALESGHAAARAVMEHFGDTAASCAAYREKTAALHAYMRRQWQLVAALSDTFSEMKQG